MLKPITRKEEEEISVPKTTGEYLKIHQVRFSSLFNRITSQSLTSIRLEVLLFQLFKCQATSTNTHTEKHTESIKLPPSTTHWKNLYIQL